MGMENPWIRILQHDRLPARALGALAGGLALLYISWGVGYYVLPEGILRGKLSGGLPMNTGSVEVLYLQILGYNLLLPGLLTVLLSLMQVGRYSLGYNVPFLNVILYGLWLGSNSFAVPMPQRQAPTLAVFVQRTGPYEMIAFLLVAAAFARSGRVRQMSFWRGPVVAVPPAERRRFGAAEYLAVALAIVILAAANLIEAVMLVERLGG